MKIAVIGAGASGLMFAVSAARLARESKMPVQIDVYEQNDRAGKKLLATGNGRCNLTNLAVKEEFYGGTYRFAEYALKKFPPESNLGFFRSLGLYTKADGEGRVYPLGNQASAVLDCLRFAAERLGVNLICSCACENIQRKGGGYLVRGRFYDRAVLACGGKAGVKAFNGYDLLSSLGHTVTKTAPSLVKLTTPDKRTKQLAGVRAAAKITLFCGKKELACQSGELQFADGVISGIAAMQLSSLASRHFMSRKTPLAVSVNFAGDFSFSRLCSALFDMRESCAGLAAENLFSGFMNKKVGQMLVKSAGIPFSADVASLSDAQLKALASAAQGCVFEISGTRGFNEAQVTAGGADTKEFSPFTLESKLNRGLYCCGEILDVDGLCGGYNLQWAWSSARLCAESIISGDRKNDKNK